jgi:ankyrin repeat protein
MKKLMNKTTVSSMKYVSTVFLAFGLCTAALAQKGAEPININSQFVMATRAGNTGRVSGLLNEGAAINSRDRNGDSPLNLAASKGNEAMVDLLMKSGADINLANPAGVTPLMGAAFSGKPSTVESLVAAGAKTDPLDRLQKNAAIYAAGSGCQACLSQLVATPVQINARLDNELTLLMWAAHDDNL